MPNSWSAQRVAVAVLDAHQSPMSSDEVINFVSARSRWSPLRPESAQFWRSGAIVVREDGVWELDRTHEVVRSAREAVRNRVSDIRRWAATRPDTVAMEAHRQRIERERTAHARELAAMRRVLVHAFPATRPRAVALVDVGAREVTTFLGVEIRPALQRLSEYAADERVEGILGNSRRQHHGHAALLVASCVAHAPKKRAAEVLGWAGELRQQYWRRHAFRQELARASESLGVTLPP